MFNISLFLDKFTKNISNNESYKKQISEIIEKIIKVNIDIKYIEIKDCVIHITSSFGVKNKIFIYKNQILKNIKNKVSVKIVDIK